MLSSGQISQLIAQQNQAFAGTAMYSQQISQSMPGMYSGSFGMPMSGGGGFSYGGQQPLGYDIGSRAGGGIMSAIGGAAHFAMGAGSMMAGLGMGGPLRYALDPFAGAGAMYRAGGAMGMGMGGRLAMGAVGMLPATALMAGASHVVGSMMSGAQEQSAIERTLGANFNFANPATGGRGFSRSQAQGIGDMVRQMEHMPDMMTSMGELTRIMDKVSQMGMMNGITNVRDFGTKFKQTLGTLKDLSKIMSSSMEEAIPIMQNLRQSGIYGGTEMRQAAMQGQIVGGLTGMNQAQVAQVRSVGAQMGFATGGYRRTGAQHAMRVAGQLGMANQMGIISNEQIAEMTGLEGAEGLQALSGELTQASYRMSQSALGTAMSIAMAEQSGGQFTGKMDAELMERFRRGDISKSEMLAMVHKKTGSRGSKMSYVRQKNRLRSEMAGAMGVEGQMSMLKMVLGERGFENPDALNIVSQGFGLDEREAELLVDLGKRMPDINIEMKQRGRAESRRIAQEAFMKDNYSWSAIKGKVGKRIEGVITEPFKKFGADLRDSIVNTIDDFVDDMTGRYKVEVTKGMSGLMQHAGMNLGDSRKRLAAMLSGKVGGKLDSTLASGVNLAPGYLGAAANWLTGTSTSGEKMVEAMQGSWYGQDRLANVESWKDRDKLMAAGYNVLDQTHRIVRNNEFTMASTKDIQATGQHIQRLLNNSMFSQGGAQEQRMLKGMLSNTDMASARQALAYRAAFGEDMQSSGYKRMVSKYGELDVIGAALQKKGGGSFVGLSDRHKLEEAAGLLDFSPDRAEKLAGAIKDFETSGAKRAFGGADAGQRFIELSKGLQGTQAGDTIFGAYLNRGMGKDVDAKRVAELVTRGDKFELQYGGNRQTTRTAMGLHDALGKGELGDMDLRHFDTYEAFKRLAVRENAVGFKHLSAGAKAAIENNQELYDSIKKRVKIKEVIQKSISSKGGYVSWTGDDKKILAELGFENPSDFTPEKAKQYGELTDLMDKLSAGGAEAVKAWDTASKTQSIVEMSQRFTKAGSDIATRAAGLRRAGVISGKAGEAMLARIEALSGKMKGMGTKEGMLSGMGVGGGTSYAEDMGSIAYDLTNMDEKTARRLASASPELEDAYDRARAVKQKLQQGGRKLESFMDIDHMLREEGGGAMVESIKKKLRVDKGGRITASDKEVAQFLAGQEGQKALTMAGAEQRSKFASQADIAKNMEAFGQNVVQLATIVQQMKDGKVEKKEGK